MEAGDISINIACAVNIKDSNGQRETRSPKLAIADDVAYDEGAIKQELRRARCRILLARRGRYWQMVSLAVMEVQRQASKVGACVAPLFAPANIIDDQTRTAGGHGGGTHQPPNILPNPLIRSLMS